MKFGVFSGFLLLVAGCFAGEAPGFKVTKRYPVPGDGGFDYIVFDGSSNHLYVSHGTEMNVLDADSGKVLGKVVGSSRVDLQACKLEYSIVSPK